MLRLDSQINQAIITIYYILLIALHDLRLQLLDTT